jgi:uridine kinase
LKGNLALYEPRILELLDMKVFNRVVCPDIDLYRRRFLCWRMRLTLDADVCLSRRLVRDINERGRHLEGILKQYFSFVKPSNENYIHKQAQIADIVIPHGPSNVKAIGKDLLPDVIHI